MSRKTKEFGEFRAAGKIIEAWLEKHPESSRKKLAGKVGMTPAAIGHWITGKSWPRKIAARDALARLGVDVAAIDAAVCEVYGLRPFGLDEMRVLEGYESASIKARAKIDEILSKESE